MNAPEALYPEPHNDDCGEWISSNALWTFLIAVVWCGAPVTAITLWCLH